MATWTHRAVIATTTNATSHASGSFTPAQGDLIAVAFSPGSLVGTGPTVTASANGITFTEYTAAAGLRASVDDVRLFVANQLVGASPSAMTVTCAGGGTDAGMIGFVGTLDSMTRTGTSAVRQAAANPNATGVTPTNTLAAAILTGNPTATFMWNATNPSGVTIPTNYTSGVADQGYATPTRGGRYAFRNSGQTSATVAWGSTSATASANILVEFDTSATQQLAASGTVAAVSAVSGSGALGLVAAGQVDATTAASGAVANILRPVDIQLDIVSGAVGAANAQVGVTGTVAGTSACTGSASVITAASGTVAAVSGATGSASPQIGAAGTVALVSDATGSAVRQAPVDAVVVAATSDVSGSAALKGSTSGVVAAVSAVSGAATALRQVAAGAFNVITEVVGAAILARPAAGQVDAVSGVYGSAGVAADITLAAELDQRLWRGTLTAREWAADLDERHWEAHLEV